MNVLLGFSEAEIDILMVGSFKSITVVNGYTRILIVLHFLKVVSDILLLNFLKSVTFISKSVLAFTCLFCSALKVRDCMFGSLRVVLDVLVASTVLLPQRPCFLYFCLL